MSPKKKRTLKQKVDELELERILNILKFLDIEKWIETMDRRWKKRVKKMQLTSLYKWLKDGWARFDIIEEKLDRIEERLDKLENPDSK